MNSATMAEIKSYQKPPYPVHEIMMATLILLGYEEKNLKNWDNIKIAMNKLGKDSTGLFFVAGNATYKSPCRSVRPSVRPTLLFRRF